MAQSDTERAEREQEALMWLEAIEANEPPVASLHDAIDRILSWFDLDELKRGRVVVIRRK